MGDTSISGIKAVGPAGEEAADVVSPRRPGGGPPPAGGCLRAHSWASGQARLSPLLLAHSWRDEQPYRARARTGFLSPPPPCPARGEAKREKALTGPHSLTPERLKLRPSHRPPPRPRRPGAGPGPPPCAGAHPTGCAPRRPRHHRAELPQTPGDNPAPPPPSPRVPPGTVVFAGGIPRRARTTSPAMPRSSPPAP